jgi:predicted kinase
MIIILRGVSGAGKDTVFDHIPELKHMVISSDDYRERWFGTRNVSPNASSLIWGKMKEELRERCIRGQSTIINATNISMKSINGWTKIGYEYDQECHVVSIEVDLGVLVHRLEERQLNGVFSDADPSFVPTMHEKMQNHTPAVMKQFGDRYHQTADAFEAANVIEDLAVGCNRRVLEEGEEQRIFLLGDIHGDIDKLTEMLDNRLPWDAQFYTLGDVIDRGPSSVGVLDKLRQDRRWAGAVRGNHETAFVTERLNGARCKSTARQRTHDEFNELSESRAHKLTMLMAKFKPYIKLEYRRHRVLLTHAGTSETDPVALFRLSAMPLSGDHMLKVENWNYHGDVAVTRQVHGHSSWTYTGDFDGPVVNIDSGCGKDEDDGSNSPRTLTAFNPFTGQTFTV